MKSSNESDEVSSAQHIKDFKVAIEYKYLMKNAPGKLKAQKVFQTPTYLTQAVKCKMRHKHKVFTYKLNIFTYIVLHERWSIRSSRV